MAKDGKIVWESRTVGRTDDGYRVELWPGVGPLVTVVMVSRPYGGPILTSDKTAEGALSLAQELIDNDRADA